MLRVNTLIIVLLLILPEVKGQGLTVRDVRIEGLKRTNERYIRRFVSHEMGDSLAIGRVTRDNQRLKNLYAIANATVRVDTLDGEGVGLVYEVTENWTLFPIVNFGGVAGNFWYQLGVSDVNWLGHGMHLNAFYLNNEGRHNYNLFYRVPYLWGSDWGFSIQAFRWASIEPFYFPEGEVRYNYDNRSIGGTGIYEFSFNHTLEAGAFYFVERHQKLPGQPAIPSPELLESPKWLYKTIHRLNRVDYHWFYLDGWENIFRYETVYSKEFRNWFHLAFSDLNWYERIGSTGNLAMRLRLGLSTNTDSPFAPFILDSQVNIRGSGNRVDRGTGVITLNMEYRQTVIDRHPFAAQLVVFSDAGTWRLPGGGFDDFSDPDNFRHFAGGGIRLIYKKAWNAILSFDYGVDLYDRDQHGPVLSIGQFF
jgi:outer membrane protein insertion porin family